MRSRFLFLLASCMSAPVCAQQAADAWYDPAEMTAARAAFKAGNGAQVTGLVLGERFEYHSDDGDSVLVLEGQGWVGGDIRKFWFKTDAEYASSDSRLEEAEIQLLYSRAVAPFWDLQTGVRYDFKPEPSRGYFVIGAQGLAPYWFELDGELFVSHKGDVSVRVEAEYEFRLSQRLLLQPRVELNAAFSDDKSIAVGSGLSSAEVGLRLRYEVVREFAPYVGVSWSRAFGRTADFQRAQATEKQDTRQVSFVAGIRFWF